MLHDRPDPESDSPSARNPALWWLLGALVAAQLMAFWGVCSQQVHRAEARSAEVQMAQMALSDCLQYIPGSTIGSCTTRVGLATASQSTGGDASADGARASHASYAVR